MREKKKEYVWKKSHEKISEKESGATRHMASL